MTTCSLSRWRHRLRGSGTASGRVSAVGRAVVSVGTVLCVATACDGVDAPALVVPRPPVAEDADSTSLSASLRQRIGTVAGAEVSLAVRDLATGRGLDVAAARVFHAASTMKVPVALAFYREVDAGRLRAADSLLLRNRFTSLVNGTSFSLSPSGDADALVYTFVGTRVRLDWLTERMITRSSNLATNALMTVLDTARINEQMRALGATTSLVRRGVGDDLANAAGLDNVTTAADLAAILASLERGQALSVASTARMRALLLATTYQDEIPAGLPPGTPVAHKTGAISGTLHDAAIVYPAGRAPYILVVLTRGIPDQPTAQRLIADLARLVHPWVVAGAR